MQSVAAPAAPARPRPSANVAEMERTIRRAVAYAHAVLRRYPSDEAIRRYVEIVEAEAASA